jgi:acetyl esterase/lipase
MIASFTGLTAAEQSELDSIGPRWGKDIQRHRDRVLEIYSPYLAKAPKNDVSVTRNVAYGGDPRQVLDVFQPRGIARAPVVMFVHGGAFIRGNKMVNDEVYANVLYYFARNGRLGLNVEYRLAPAVRYPDASHDLAGAVTWARENAGRLGGDPERIFFIGHSAGATHLATYVCDPRARPASGHGLRGIVLVSGRLRIDARPDNPNAGGVRGYYGDDASTYAAASPVTHAGNLDVPALIAIAEFENPLLDIYGAEFLHRVSEAQGRAPRFIQMPRHNHITMMAHFNTADDFLGREVLAFIGRHA